MSEAYTSEQWASIVQHYLSHLTRLGISHLPHHPVDWVHDAAEQLHLNRPAEISITTASPATASTTTSSPPAQPARTVEPRADTPAPVSIPAKPALVDNLFASPETQQWLTPKLERSGRSRALDLLAQQVAGCTRCDVLSCRRHRTVFGEGNHEPRVCFFGEAPGADEDRTGRPFVGAAGQLLDKIITACTFRREDVFILNTVKCRPPENRNPTDEEIGNCREYFENQFELLQPEYIVCLGLVAARALIPSAPSIGRLRSRFHTYRGAKVLVTYHPSYLLRNPAAKAATWEDMKMLLREMKIELPKRA